MLDLDGAVDILGRVGKAEAATVGQLSRQPLRRRQLIDGNGLHARNAKIAGAGFDI